MSRRVVLLHSQSDHLLRAVEALRAEHPGADIALLDSNPAAPALPGSVTVESCAAKPGGGRLQQALALMRHLRGNRPDVCCVLYASPALRLLAAASGARERCWCGEDGVLRALPESLFGTMVDLACTRIRGELLYAWLWLIVRVTRADPFPP